MLEWRVHLAANEPLKAAAVLLVALSAAGLAALLWQGPLPAFGVLFVLVNAVAEFLFPVTYRLTPDGAESRCLLQRRTIAWSEVRRVYCLPGGVKLSPLERQSRLEAYRGLVLRFGGNESEVLTYLQQVRGSGG